MLYITQFIVGFILEFAVLYIYLDIEDLGSIDLGTAVLALNLVTHPVLIYVIPLIQVNYVLSLIISEILVMLVEALLLTGIFTQLSKKKAFESSVLANLASWQFAPFLIYAVVTVKGLAG